MKVLGLLQPRGKHGGVKAIYFAEHKTQDGRLISRQATRKHPTICNWYDNWRANYCERHRNSKLPLSFREGRLTPFAIIVSVILRIGDRNYKKCGCQGG